MNYRDTLKINTIGHLEIGGVDTVDLAKKYGTPLYVLDEAYVRNVCRAYTKTLSAYGDGAIAYASKALSCKAIYKIMIEENMSIDVVSMGELATAISVGFPTSKIYFHGNNKLISELEFAIKNRVGTIVADNLEELSIIDNIAKAEGITQSVLLRINPGVEAHTHNFVQTAKIDSKFGFYIFNGDAKRAVETALKYENLSLKGLHTHIGSQIFEKEAFALAVEKMTDFIKELHDDLSFETNVLNMGGGFGVWYTDEDPRFSVEEYAEYVKNIIDALNSAVIRKNIKKPFLVLEPGRSIVCEAGITLYSVGMIKDIQGVKKYVCIDGGMGDNPRYALYQAKYSAIIANKANEKPIEEVTLAGKCCESGDMIATVDLARAERGDVIAVFSTGAYNYSMSSNYNRNPVPPVIMVKNGKSAYAVKPQTLEDIMRNDTIPDWME